MTRHTTISIKWSTKTLRWALLASVILCALLAGNALAKSGPILSERVPDRIFDNFEKETSGCSVSYLPNKQDCVVERLANGGRFGKGCLQVTLKPPVKSEHPRTGGNVIRLSWKFKKTIDLSAYDEIVFFYKTNRPFLQTPWWHTPTWYILPGTGGVYSRGATQSDYGEEIDPMKTGEWQPMRIKLDSKANQWWYSSADIFGYKASVNVSGVTEIRLELRNKLQPGEKPLTFELDGVGLYMAEQQSGAKVRLWAPRGYWVEPEQNYLLEAIVSDLPAGQKAEVRVEAFDAHGMVTNQAKAQRKVSFTSRKGAIEAEPAPDNNYMHIGRVVFPNEGPGFVHLAATLNVGGKDVWRDEISMGCLRPFAREDQEPNENSIFGFWQSPVQKAREMGAKWMRMRLSPSSVMHGAFNDKRISVDDGDMAKYNRIPSGMHVIALLGGPTKDLSSHPESKNYGMCDPADWQKFAEMWEPVILWARDNGIKHFEVINEPFDGQYSGNLVKLHEEQYKLIHRIIPDAHVLGPCPQGMFIPEIDQFLAEGGKKCVDDIVVHAYTSPEDLRVKLQELRGVMAKHGLGDRGIYITEQGEWSLRLRDEVPHASYLVKSYVISLAEGVRVLLAHGLSDIRGVDSPTPPIRNIAMHRFMINRVDGMASPPSVAIAVEASVLERAKYIGELQGLPSGVECYRFTKRGSEILVLWSPKGKSAQVSVPVAGASTRMVKLLGEESELKQSNGQVKLIVTDEPVYLLSGPVATIGKQ